MADENDNVSVDAGSESEISDGTDLFSDPSGEIDSLMNTINGLDAKAREEDDKIEEKKVEQPVVEEKKPEEVKTPPEADRGLERLAAKEKEVRELRESFEKERGNYINLNDLRNKTTEALTKAGLDPDVLMKTILYERLPDGNPVKAKLKTELSEILTEKKISALKEEMETRDRQAKLAAEQARNYQETLTKIDSFVSKFKEAENKSLPTLSLIGKEDAGVLKELVIEEMINDAAVRYAKGEDGDPISHEDAANRIEKRLAKLAALLNKSPANANNMGSSNSNASKPTGVKKSVKPGPARASGPVNKTSAQEADEMVNNMIAAVKSGRRS